MCQAGGRGGRICRPSDVFCNPGSLSENSCKSLRICLLIFFFFFLLELLISKSVKFLGKQSLVSILEIPRPHLILLGGKITERNLVYCVSSALLHFVFHTKKKGNLRVCKSVSLQQPERAEKRGKSGNEVLTNLVP